MRSIILGGIVVSIDQEGKEHREIVFLEKKKKNLIDRIDGMILGRDSSSFERNLSSRGILLEKKMFVTNETRSSKK